jgi:hypothetical protein
VTTGPGGTQDEFRSIPLQSSTIIHFRSVSRETFSACLSNNISVASDGPKSANLDSQGLTSVNAVLAEAPDPVPIALTAACVIRANEDAR